MRNCQRAIVAMSVFAALCALWPGFAIWTSEYISEPLMAFLARVSAFVPVIPLALVIVAILLRPRIIASLTVAIAVFALAWVPPMAAPAVMIPDASNAALTALREILTDDISAMGRHVPGPEEALEIAGKAMYAPAAPRAAYFPYAMKKLCLAGIYIPVTGEAVVDTTRPAAGLIFTAAHELAHMRGIADETAANIAAYEACISHGGAAAYSARLWALRYTIGRLGSHEIPAGLAPEILADLLSLPCAPGNDNSYARLADHLANIQK